MKWKACWGNFELMTAGLNRDTNKGAFFVAFAPAPKPLGRVWRRLGQRAFDAPRRAHKGYDLLGVVSRVTNHGGGKYTLVWSNGQSTSTVDMTEEAPGRFDFISKVPHLTDGIGTMTCQ